VLPLPARVADMGADRSGRTFAVNALAPLLCAGEAVRRMSTARGGHGGVIVNVSSRAAVRGAAGEFVDYAMSKAALDTLTVGLAAEVATDGIRVNGVRPGLIATDMNSAPEQRGRLERLLATVPMGRPGPADEVAEAVRWLASDAAGYVTGVTLDVSGGRSDARHPGGRRAHPRHRPRRRPGQGRPAALRQGRRPGRRHYPDPWQQRRHHRQRGRARRGDRGPGGGGRRRRP